MTLSLTCKNQDCGAVLDAETEDELVNVRRPMLKATDTVGRSLASTSWPACAGTTPATLRSSRPPSRTRRPFVGPDF